MKFRRRAVVVVESGSVYLLAINLHPVARSGVKCLNELWIDRRKAGQFLALIEKQDNAASLGGDGRDASCE